MKTTRCESRPGICILACLVFLVCFPLAGPEADAGEVLEKIKTPGSCPTGLTWDSGSPWVTDRKTDMIYRLDSEGNIAASFKSPGFHPAGLTWDGSHLWNVDKTEKMLYRINPATGDTVRAFESPASSPEGLAWDGTYLWLVERRKGKLLQISPEDGTTITEIPAPSRYVQGLTFDGTYLWAVDRVTDQIYMLTPDEGTVVLIMDAPGPYPRGLAWDGESLWCADYQDNFIYRLEIPDARHYKKTDEKIEYVEYTHELRNYGPDTVRSLDIYLAVPGQRDNQEILEGPVFSPEPQEFLVDRWGQKVARFHFDNLEAPGAAKVTFKARVKLSTIRYYIFPEKVKPLSDIPPDIQKLYCGDLDKYMLDDPFITAKVKELAEKETNPYWIARRLYDYVISAVEYEMVGGWNVAPMVLKRGTGSCSEYTFSLIALCRAAGVPARYVGSVVIRGEDASLDEAFHRWVEIYLPGYGWVPFDANAGDRALPAEQAAGIGEVENRFLITTEGGGASEYLEWGYNSGQSYTCSGRCKVHLENIGEWRPAEPAPAEGK